MSRTSFLWLLTLLPACGGAPDNSTAPSMTKPDPKRSEPAARPDPVRSETAAATETATLAGGCFWCMEAALEQVDGVLDVRSGYTGGTTRTPSYHDVCSGTTGHAEAVEVTFDPKKISYEQLLGWFWRLHDPTSLNKQGGDVGTQYRSAIFTHSEAQQQAAERSRAAAQKAFVLPIVTEITPAGTFYVAEEYHQDYFRKNPDQQYCQAVIAPKLGKLGLKK
jgi:peptide-methionine (S)-S-oxide reductase